mmetsp:Transcript_31459/g.78392  ORF Transcript_31459/g.78392 Transcript_31459/m.78392 type:complete len:280 (+) Transcript_31459:501-1340(+)
MHLVLVLLRGGEALGHVLDVEVREADEFVQPPQRGHPAVARRPPPRAPQPRSLVEALARVPLPPHHAIHVAERAPHQPLLAHVELLGNVRAVPLQREERVAADTDANHPVAYAQVEDLSRPHRREVQREEGDASAKEAERALVLLLHVPHRDTDAALRPAESHAGAGHAGDRREEEYNEVARDREGEEGADDRLDHRARELPSVKLHGVSPEVVLLDGIGVGVAAARPRVEAKSDEHRSRGGEVLQVHVDVLQLLPLELQHLLRELVLQVGLVRREHVP